MATQCGDAMKDVEMGDATIKNEHESSSAGGEATDGVQSQMGTSAAEKRECSPLKDPEAKRIKSEEDEMREQQWREDPERKRKQVVEKPWLYETERLLIEAPDINYRRIILGDQDNIDQLLANQSLHFKERCLQYQRQDVWVEWQVLTGYIEWAQSMGEDASAKDNAERAVFFRGLESDLQKEYEEVDAEHEDNRHEELLRTGTRDLMGNGGLIFDEISGWWHYETARRQWVKEPDQKGERYEILIQQWRDEAVKKGKKRYYDSVEQQSYGYNQEQGRWRAEQRLYTKDEGHVTYGEGIWGAQDRLSVKATNDPTSPPTESTQSLPTEQEKNHEEDDTKNDGAANENALSPTPSTNTQAEIDTQLAITLFEAA